MVSFHGCPGLREGFWSDSNTEMSFLGRLMLIKVQLRTDSARVMSRSTRLCSSGLRGGWSGREGKSSFRARRQNSKMDLKVKVNLIELNLEVC